MSESGNDNLSEREILASAVGLFNVGRYWDVHEVLERQWLKASGEHKQWLAGWILLAAALHQQRVLRHQDPAERLFQRALRRWGPLPEAFGGMNLRATRLDVRRALSELEFTPLLPALEI